MAAEKRCAGFQACPLKRVWIDSNLLLVGVRKQRQQMVKVLKNKRSRTHVFIYLRVYTHACVCMYMCEKTKAQFVPNPRPYSLKIIPISGCSGVSEILRDLFKFSCELFSDLKRSPPPPLPSSPHPHLFCLHLCHFT